MKPPTTGERIRRCSICGGTIDGGSMIGTGDGSMTANNGLGSFAHADCYRIEELRQALATATARAEKAEAERDALRNDAEKYRAWITANTKQRSELRRVLNSDFNDAARKEAGL